jgi:hypothetical protein
MGELDRASTSRYQYDVVEANITVHAPVLTAGGIDLKIGQYSTPLGFEVIEPSANRSTAIPTSSISACRSSTAGGSR